MKRIYIAIFLNIILLLYITPIFFYGENSTIDVHDVLDVHISKYKILANSNKIFSSNTEQIEQVFNGLPRVALRSEFNIILWLFYFFNDFYAYLINFVLVHLIAFWSMYLFLSRYLIKDKQDKIIIPGVSLIFSLLPFYYFMGLSIASMPLLLLSFLKIRENKGHILDWFLIILIPLYSSFIGSGFFFFVFISSIFLFDLFIKKKRQKKMLLAILLYLLIGLIVEYRLIIMFFTKSYTSHRVEIIQDSYSIKEMLKQSYNLFINSQYHIKTVHKLFIPIVFFSFIICLFKKNKKIKKILLLLSAIILISLFYSLWKFDILISVKNHIKLLNMIQLDRFYALLPILWYSLIALSLYIIIKYFKTFGKILVISLIIIQCFLLFNKNTLYNPIKINLYSLINKISPLEPPTYKEFFSKDLFTKIDSYINKPKNTYRVVSIGIHPAISLYNGFYTLDGYFTNYPLTFKHNFREIIEKELDKNKGLKNYFDTWGSRCYILVDELGKDFLICKNHNIKSIENLELNIQKLKEMNCHYIFSAVEILNYKDNSLDFLRTFENSYWNIYLYKIN